MLLELKVNHFAIINNVHIQFEPGFNILSGETGAGKTVLIKSLALLMGAKAQSDSVRTGYKEAIIEGFFDLGHRPDVIEQLSEMGISVDEDLLSVRRVVNAQGKSRVYLNGSLSALNGLKEVIAPLIEVAGRNAPLIELTGQHENKHLQSKAYHLELLDQYCGTTVEKQAFKELLQELTELKSELSELQKTERDREQQVDFLRFQKEEIELLKIQPGEEEDIKNQMYRLKNISKLQGFLDQVEDTLYNEDDSALTRVNKILSQSREFCDVDSDLDKKFENLQSAYALIEDFTYELRDYKDNLDIDPQQLNILEEQYSYFKKLQKKYGQTVEEIYQALDEVSKELFKLENSETHLKDLKQQIQLKEKQCWKLAESLHKKRTEGSLLLVKTVNDELKDLNMKGLKFLVSMDKDQELNMSGCTQAEFMIKVAKNDQPKALTKYASGGELSRILLALKCVLGKSEHPRTYFFDEVDT
ncbi:MAG: AAA family ATPase, partial [Bdellovibrionales bacterium]|nr:AAA family ATPase [Bdellovibrionales bacterium]